MTSGVRNGAPSTVTVSMSSANATPSPYVTRLISIEYPGSFGSRSEMNATYSAFDAYVSPYGPTRVKSSASRSANAAQSCRVSASSYCSTIPVAATIYLRGSLMAFLAMMFFWISVAPAPIDVYRCHE